jgi:hypothetical protein
VVLAERVFNKRDVCRVVLDEENVDGTKHQTATSRG